MIDQSEQADSGVFPALSTDVMSRFLQDVSMQQQVEQSNMLQCRLNEALKTLEAEKKDKEMLQKEIDAQQEQLTTLESKCDEVTLAKSELAQNISASKMDYNCQLRTLMRQIDDNASIKNNLQLMVVHLREEVSNMHYAYGYQKTYSLCICPAIEYLLEGVVAYGGLFNSSMIIQLQIERLQAENAEEWGRRERLESEKCSLERQCKKIRSLNEDLKNRLDKLSAHNAINVSAEVSKLQHEVETYQNDMSELKHANSKIKKVLNQNNEELAHWKRKSDQSDKEVRNLRHRIEQLKQEFDKAQDDLDSCQDSIRRLERSNEELASQNEGLQVQIEHQKLRLRNVSSFDMFKKVSRVSAPGGILDYRNNDDSSTSTDENEFNYNEDEVNETDV